MAKETYQPRTLYKFQELAQKYIKNGEDVLIVAPTGFGKTNAALGLKVDSNRKIIYTLPTRSLTHNLSAKFADQGATELTGDNMYDTKWLSQLVFCTIDQLVSALVNGSYALSNSMANISPGAILQARIIIDEIHLIPYESFKTLLMLRNKLRSLGLCYPQMICMSATVPKQMQDYLVNQGFRLIAIDDKYLKQVRKHPVFNKKKISLIEKNIKAINVSEIKRLYDKKQRIIIVCNTKKDANIVYERVHKKINSAILLHADFFPQHRRKKEDFIVKYYGRKKITGAVIIVTQVIEVGMDITCDVLYTSLTQANSLIQRIGRCARFAGESGEVKVYTGIGLGDCAIYRKKLMIATKDYLKQKESLSWKDVNEIINEVHHYDTAMEVSDLEQSTIDRNEEIMNSWRTGFYDSNNIRDGQPRIMVQVSDNLATVLNKEWISIQKSMIREIDPFELKEYRYDKNSKGMIWDRYKGLGGLVVIPTKFASYSEELGLRLGTSGQLDEAPIANKRRKSFGSNIVPQEYHVHVGQTMKMIRYKEIQKELNWNTKQISRMTKLTIKEVKNLLKTVIRYHDIGKLDIRWQKMATRAGLNAQKQWGKVGGNFRPAISHAPVSGLIAYDALRKTPFGLAIALAVLCHHNSHEASNFNYRLCKFNDHNGIIERKMVKYMSRSKVSFSVRENITSSIEKLDEKMQYLFWIVYFYLVRYLRLCDMQASYLANLRGKK